MKSPLYLELEEKRGTLRRDLEAVETVMRMLAFGATGSVEIDADPVAAVITRAVEVTSGPPVPAPKRKYQKRDKPVKAKHGARIPTVGQEDPAFKLRQKVLELVAKKAYTSGEIYDELRERFKYSGATSNVYVMMSTLKAQKIVESQNDKVDGLRKWYLKAAAATA